MNRFFLTLVFSGLIAFRATAQTPNLPPPEIQGRELAQELLQQQPAEDFTNTGVLQVHGPGGAFQVPIQFSVTKPNSSKWLSIYQTETAVDPVKLVIVHRPDAASNEYRFRENGIQKDLQGNETMLPFAGSDFWICDLGLEFFLWPEQKILKHDTRRTRACAVLESTNPKPAPGAYSRVDSWIDDETLGIVHAEAYDANGKLLKVFDPKSFKKVNGQWELQNMEIRNVQTGSRTWIKFHLRS